MSWNKLSIRWTLAAANPSTYGFSRTTSAMALAGLICLALSSALRAQDWTIHEEHDWCDEHDWNASYCEVREVTLPAGREEIRIDAGKNGGISIEGWDKDEIQLLVQIRVWNERRRDARDFVEEIHIKTGRTITSSVPRALRHDNYATSFRLKVPQSSNLQLDTYNGGIQIRRVQGEIDFNAVNGGISLIDVGGSVDGVTTNGGIDIDLRGTTWNGDGLNVETTNGGIHLSIPEDYSAKLIAGSANGRLRCEVPARIRSEKEIREILGKGGPLIRVLTRNGSLDIRES